jgi:hypothetical protein
VDSKTRNDPNKTHPPPRAGPKYISSENRDTLGPPTGRKSDVNPLGYSKKQIFALGVLVDDDKYRDRTDSEDTWRTGSIAASGSNRREHLRLNIFTTSTNAPYVKAEVIANRNVLTMMGWKQATTAHASLLRLNQKMIIQTLVPNAFLSLFDQLT